MKKTLDLKELQNQEEREIVMHLKKHKQCAYGEIIKDLKLSYIKGQERISFLVSKGIIKFVGSTSNLELAVTIV